MENTYIKTFGQGKVYVQHGDEHEMHAAKWDVDYDGNEWDIDVHVNRDGKRDHIHETLDSEDMYRLMQQPSTPGLLDKRLRQDFLVDQKIYKIIPRKGKTAAMIATRKQTPSKIKSSRATRSSTSKKTSSRKSALSKRRSTSAKKTSSRKSAATATTTTTTTTKRKTKKASSTKKSSRSSGVKRIRKQVLKHIATPKPRTKRIHLTK